MSLGEGVYRIGLGKGLSDRGGEGFGCILIMWPSYGVLGREGAKAWGWWGS